MKTRLVACALGAVLVSAAGASAQVAWSNPNGTASFFTWSGGQNDTGLYGSPVLVGGDTFVFTPSDFVARSINGAGAEAHDRLQVDLIANPGFRFSAIDIQEIGDWAVLTQGSVSATGQLTIEDNLIAGRSAVGPLITNPTFPITTPGFDSWTGDAGVDLGAAGPSWTHIRLIVENNLIAISAPGSSTFIQKTFTGAGVSITIVPAPASAALLGLGGLVAARRRRA